MRQYLFVYGLLAFCFTLSNSIFAQDKIPDISGWKRKEVNGIILYTPSTLFKTGFAYELMPLSSSKLESSLEEWLTQQGQKELAADGYSILKGNQNEVKQVKSINTWVMITEKGTQKWVICYVAFQRKDGLVRYGRIVYPNAINSPYTSTALMHFINLSRNEGTLPTNSDLVSKTANPDLKKDPYLVLTEPGKGLSDANIKGIVLNRESGFGVGGMVIIEYNAYLLLKDGTIYKYPKDPPYDLNIAQSRKLEPKKWGTWTSQGSTLVVKLPTKGVMKTEQWEKGDWFWAEPAKSDEKISGRFRTISGGGNTAMGGDAMVVSSSNITFNSNGQFTYASTSGGSNSGSGVDVSAYSDKKSAGTYYLKGYCMELRFKDGVIKRKLFYFYPKVKDTFAIGTSDYVPVH